MEGLTLTSFSQPSQADHFVTRHLTRVIISACNLELRASQVTKSRTACRVPSDCEQKERMAGAVRKKTHCQQKDVHT